MLPVLTALLLTKAEPSSYPVEPSSYRNGNPVFCSMGSHASCVLPAVQGSSKHHATPPRDWAATHPASGGEGEAKSVRADTAHYLSQEASKIQKGNLAPCDGTAYATLLTMHTATNSTQISKHARRSNGRVDRSASVAMQIKLINVLVRSVRATERRCRRDFVLLLGKAVSISPTQQAILTRLDGFYTRRVAALREGVPAIDRLHAWTLTEYSRIVSIDADAMILRPMDALFGDPDAGSWGGNESKLMMANHPYDIKQAACGRAIGDRVIGALAVLTPSMDTFAALLRDMSARPWQHWALTNYSEQTGLACFFSDAHRLVALPCSTLWDVSISTSVLRERWLRECTAYSGESSATCHAIQAHTKASCTWSAVRAHVYGVHFKGKSKPWTHLATRACHPVRAGRLRVQGDGRKQYVAPTDELQWRQGTCINAASYDLPTVTWATGDPVPARCCKTEILLQAEFYFLHFSSHQRSLQPPYL